MRINYKDRILQGAKELFYLHGIKKITMDDIARHLSISKKTIYKEYADKNDIVKAICVREFSVHKSKIDILQQKADNAIDAITGIMKYVHEYLDKINPNYFYDMQKYHPKAWKVYIEFKNNYIISSVIGNLKQGQEEKLYRDNLNIDIISRLRIAEMNAALDTELYPPNNFRLVDIHDELLSHFLQGITTLKGHRLINKYFNIHDSENVRAESVFAEKN